VNEPKVGEPGGFDWVLAGGLGAMISAGDEPLLLMLKAFAVSLGFDARFADAKAAEWLPEFKAHLKKRGIANT
jgi:hypothetical protein